MRNTNKILYWIIALLVLTLVLGTTVGVTVRKIAHGEIPISTAPAPKEAVNLNQKSGAKTAEFKELGTLRIISKPEPPEKKNAPNNNVGSTIVLTPWLSYPDGDTVFFEELSRKRLAIKNVFLNYFSSYTKNELSARGEEKIKADLLEMINEQLTLGKISAVYFSDYIFLQ